MALPRKAQKEVPVQPSYVTLNKDGKPVWEPGLKAEVTSRRQPRPKRKAEPEEEPPVQCDLKVTLKMPPDARAGWLEKALKAIPKGKAKPQDVFDIITHQKFVSGVPEELGTKMLQIVKESLIFFSEKQQLNIAKCKLVKEFKPSTKRSGKHGRDSDDERDHRSSDDDASPVGRRHFTEVMGRSEERRRDASEGRSADVPVEKEKEKVQEEPPVPGHSGLSPEEQARAEREFAEREKERQRKREEELRKLEMERKAHAERERLRKQKIGNAFLMDEDEEEPPPPPTTRVPPVEKRAEDRHRGEEESLGFGLRLTATPVSTLAISASTSSAIATMGGDSIVTEAQQILQRGAGQFLEKSPRRGRSAASRSWDRRRNRRSRSRSRSRSRPPRGAARGGSPRRGNEDRRRRAFDSLRSPTPDGHLRGQMRAARKAKMMAQMLQQGTVPRVA